MLLVGGGGCPKLNLPPFGSVRSLAAGTEAASAARIGDDQRRVIGADHKTPTPASAPKTGACAADGDLQHLPCGQIAVAADLGSSTAIGVTNTIASATLRAKGDDLIGALDRHAEGDEAYGIIEFEPLGMGGRF